MRYDVSTHTLEPMTIDQARVLVRRYLGSFPFLNLHDPEIYIADLCTLLCGYPLWAGENAVQTIKETIKFPTTHAEIKPLLDEQVRMPKFMERWEREAREQLERRSEPEPLAIEGPEEPPRLTYAELRAKYDGPNGEPWGISNRDHIPRKSKQQYRDELIAQYGRETIDAIPDAKVSMPTLGEYLPK